MNNVPFDLFSNYKSTIKSPELSGVVKWLVDNGHRAELDTYQDEYDKCQMANADVPELHHVRFNDFGRWFLFKVFNAKCKEIVPGATDLSDNRVFRNLKNKVFAENAKGFFPLRDDYTRTQLKGEPNTIFVETHVELYKKYNSITTAAMTLSGDIIFNTKFCQNLVNFAYLCGTKVKGKKYVNGGGKVPDDMHYLEFLVMHELLHYRSGDFHMATLLKESDEIINYASDYRSNYKLVKEGHHMLPMGLFSAYLNYDQQKTLREIVDYVKELLEKNKQHEEPGDTDTHYSADGKAKTEEADDVDDPRTPAEKELSRRRLDRITEDQINEREQDINETDVSPSGEAKPEKEDVKSKNVGDPTQGFGKGDPKKVDLENQLPKYNWQTILRRAVTSAVNEFEESYAKMRNMGSRMQTVRITGTAVVRPGEVAVERPKILFVADTSYSMAHTNPEIFANLQKLMKSTNVASDMLMVNFSDDYYILELDIRRKTAKRIEPTNLKQKKNVSWESVIELQNSSTDLSLKLTNYLIAKAAEGYTIIMTSDSDIVHDANWSNLRLLMKNAKNNFNVIFATSQDYREFVAKLGVMPKNASYFKE